MSQLKPGYTIYCDESRHTTAADNPYMTIGGLWVPTEKKAELLVKFRALLEHVGLGRKLSGQRRAA